MRPEPGTGVPEEQTARERREQLFKRMEAGSAGSECLRQISCGRGEMLCGQLTETTTRESDFLTVSIFQSVLVKPFGLNTPSSHPGS